MSLFTASNGVVLDEHGDEYDVQLRHRKGDTHEARKEFYQHLRDKELGRWRDPESPNFVVYHSDIEYVRVVNEATGASNKAYRDGPNALSVAKRYFEAHPEPMPWHDAEPGEIWVLEFGGEKRAYARTTAFFAGWGTPSLLPTDTGIKGGYRIWPEVAK